MRVDLKTPKTFTSSASLEKGNMQDEGKYPFRTQKMIGDSIGKEGCDIFLGPSVPRILPF